MTVLTNEEIKTVSLQIMVEVHSFCEKNDIRYTLGYGTLLGAVRHKGFIPWDDDLDILMPRPDYEKFCNTFKSDKDYEVISSYTNNCYLAYARVCDMKATLVEPYAPWCDRITGVWIDVFPIDGAHIDQNKQDNQYIKALNTYDALNSFRVVFKNKFNGLVDYLRYIKRVLMYKNIKSLSDTLSKICKEVHFGETKFIQDFSCPVTRKKQIYSLSCLNEFILIGFEEYSFYCMSGYHEALECWYGDYMKLPPIEKRIYSHSLHKYYWINK